MSPERLRGTSIVWRFAITSLLVFALIGIGIAALRTRDLRARSEESATDRAELIAERVIAPLLDPTDLDGGADGPRYDELRAEIEELAMEDGGVERVKIWNRDGTVIFSSDPAQVGARPEPEEDLLEAFEGEVASEISDLDEPENASERRLAEQLFETYVPVDVHGVDASDEADAVIEVYQDYSAIQREIDDLKDTLTISLGTGLLVLYVLLLPLMIGTTRTLQQKNQQLGELLAREQETVAELRELDRLKSDFAAAASHELRTPLTTIHGYAELLRDRPGAADPDTRDAIEAIARQTGHLQRLVGNLLREAQLEHGDVGSAEEPTAVAVVLEEVRRGFPGAVDRIRLRVEPDLPSIALDPIALHEIAANLVDNALKYSASGSPVSVEAGIEGGALVIRVRDEGRGIPPGDLPRIFDRFTQIDGSSTRAYGGVGLGLHLVRELTRRAGGDVDVDSELGRGSTFTVRIPLGSGDPDRETRRPEVTTA
ncbi:MAG TPA: ATP-binding protein [Actinomycetota bacterium]|nr:ATP-binding protein [Actinomycetota bacterium]